MNTEKSIPEGEQPHEESKMGRYFRYLLITTGLIFFLVLIVSMIMKKFGA